MRRPVSGNAGFRQPQLIKQPPGARRRNSQTTSIPAPVGGWNVRDSVANMNPTDANIMENWFPNTGYVQVRKGWEEHVTGIGAQVETLMPYNEADGTETLFAIADGDIYDVTSSGSVGSAEVTGLTNARWEYVNFYNSSGISYLCAFNGVDNPRYYDGTNWTEITGASSPAITGVTPSDLNNPWIHKRRMWLVENDTLSAWYLPVDAVGGAASEFDLAGIFMMGGFLIAGGTWTRDAGNGPDDYQVFVTSEGEVAVYQGTNPASADTWALVGVYRIGEPIGRRCLMKFAGELLVICKDGVYPMSKAIQSSVTNPRAAITDKIEGAMSQAAERYSNNFGWQLLFFPSGDMLMLNVPVGEGFSQQQYVMNTITGAWGQFTGVESNCWAMLNEEPYFGGDGFVGKFWSVQNDNGNNIQADMQQAYSYFGDRGSIKRFSMIRPLISSDGSPNILAALNTDYSDEKPTASLSFSPITAGVWDSGLWDSAVWGTGLVELKNWQSVAAVGTSAALRLLAASQNISVRLQASDYVFERGNVI